jgi:hypothetical protein
MSTESLLLRFEMRPDGYAIHVSKDVLDRIRDDINDLITSFGMAKGELKEGNGSYDPRRVERQPASTIRVSVERGNEVLWSYEQEPDKANSAPRGYVQGGLTPSDTHDICAMLSSSLHQAIKGLPRSTCSTSQR